LPFAYTDRHARLGFFFFYLFFSVFVLKTHHWPAASASRHIFLRKDVAPSTILPLLPAGIQAPLVIADHWVKQRPTGCMCCGKVVLTSDSLYHLFARCCGDLMMGED